MEECKRPTQTAFSRVTGDQRSNLTDSIIQLSEKDRYDLEIKLLKLRPLRLNGSIQSLFKNPPRLELTEPLNLNTPIVPSLPTKPEDQLAPEAFFDVE